MPLDPPPISFRHPLAATPTGDDAPVATAPPTVIEETVVLRTAVGRDRVEEVRTRLRYETARPYEVRLTFHPGHPDEADWVLSRQLLSDGLDSPSGEGDIRLWPAHCPCHGETLHLALESPHGSALLEAPRAELRSWLDRTYAVLTVEDENDTPVLTDEMLAALLDHRL